MRRLATPLRRFTSLFSLLGVQYGGDAVNTFGVPNLNGRVAMHKGTGTGLTPRTQGQLIGAETVTLDSSHLASHSHLIALNNGLDGATSVDAPDNNVYLSQPRSVLLYNATPAAEGYTLTSETIGNGGNTNPTAAPRDNMQPYLTLVYAIATEGIWPPKPDPAPDRLAQRQPDTPRHPRPAPAGRG